MVFPFNMYTQIRLSCLETFFHNQGFQYRAFQQAEIFTDIVVYCKGGHVSLHQAVLLPLSRVLVNFSSLVSMSDKPLVLVLPDYDVSTIITIIIIMMSVLLLLLLGSN